MFDNKNNVPNRSSKENKQIANDNSIKSNSEKVFSSDQVQSLQSTYGNRFTEAFVRQRFAAQPRIQEQQSLSNVIQREVKSDLKDGKNYLGAAQGYQNEVLKGMDSYSNVISQAEASQYEKESNAMAQGYKKWSENYYKF
jgi:hypothetical protein